MPRHRHSRKHPYLNCNRLLQELQHEREQKENDVKVKQKERPKEEECSKRK